MDLKTETHFVGAWGENFIIEKLLEKRFELFKPLIDLGIDLVIRKNESEYLELQIKTVSKTCKDPSWFQIKNLKPRDSFFIICISEKFEKFWVIPSSIFFNKSIKSKDQKGNVINDLNLSQKKFDADKEIKKLENNLDILLK